MKVDMGYKRAGVIPSTPECESLIDGILAAADTYRCFFHGIYAHAGHSYQARHDWESFNYLAAEFKALEAVSTSIRKRRPSLPLVLSVGATPTATCLQHPDLGGDNKGTREGVGSAGLVNEYISNPKNAGFKLEIHAGVYPALDLQQLATHACDNRILSSSSITITVLCEIASLYPRRGPNGTTEALINAGCLALGREPCADMGTERGDQHYTGWGIVAPWGVDNPVPEPEFPAIHGGWQVGKVSQEHGILRWVGRVEDEVPLKYGQKVRIWPNHACVAGASYDYYFIVDGRQAGKEDEVVDVWPR
jgi:D-serine ammonia-lyase